MQTVENQKNDTSEVRRLYSQTAIAVATFLGGPFAAGILARRNFINLGKAQTGTNALIIGIISTILLFGGIFVLPEDILDKIPNALIPTIYTAIIYVIIEKFQGAALKEHKAQQKPFYSIWKAIGTGTVCMLVLLVGIFGYAYLSDDWVEEPLPEAYMAGREQFDKNEDAAMALYDLLENELIDPDTVISFIDHTGIPAWKDNLAILDTLDKMAGLDASYIQTNDILRQYTNVRIQIFELLKTAVREDTDLYNNRIEMLHRQIETLVNKLE
jgi:hypothetical protein